MNNISTALVISPHSDDAVISLGSYLNETYKQVIVLNLFTVSSSNMLNIEFDSSRVTRLRASEDAEIARVYNFVFKNLDLPDSEERGIRWDDHDAEIDIGLRAEVANWLYEQISRFPERKVLYVPAAFGLHPDHYLALSAMSSRKLHNIINELPIRIYAEQPYYAESSAFHAGHQILQQYAPKSHDFDKSIKHNMLTKYPSQLDNSRIDMLTNIGKEYWWDLDGLQLSQFFFYSLMRNGEGELNTFTRYTWQYKTAKSYGSPERRFRNFPLGDYNQANKHINIAIEKFSHPLFDGHAARFGNIFTSDYADANMVFRDLQMEDLIDRLLAEDVDILWFSNIPASSKTHELLLKLSITHPDCFMFHGIPSLGSVCGLTYSDWLSFRSKNTRRNISRKWKKLADYSTQTLNREPEFVIEQITSESLNTLLEHQSLRAKYTDSLDDLSLPNNTEFIKFLYTLSADEGAYIAKIVVRNKTISSLLILDDNKSKSLGIYLQSFDPVWYKFSPSYCTISELIRHAHTKGYKYVDLLRGDEYYKQQFSNRQIDLFKFVMFLNPKLDRGRVLQFIKRYEE